MCTNKCTRCVAVQVGGAQHVGVRCGRLIFALPGPVRWFGWARGCASRGPLVPKRERWSGPAPQRTHHPGPPRFLRLEEDHPRGDRCSSGTLGAVMCVWRQHQKAAPFALSRRRTHVCLAALFQADGTGPVRTLRSSQTEALVWFVFELRRVRVSFRAARHQAPPRRGSRAGPGCGGRGRRAWTVGSLSDPPSVAQPPARPPAVRRGAFGPGEAQPVKAPAAAREFARVRNIHGTGPGRVGGAAREDPVEPAPAPIAFRSAPPPAPEPGRLHRVPDPVSHKS